MAVFKKGDIVRSVNDYATDIGVDDVFVVLKDSDDDGKIYFIDKGDTVRIRPGDAYTKVNKFSVGDRITDEDGDFEREVVSVGEDFFVTKDKYDGSNDLNAWYLDELKDHKLVSEGEVELTLEEVAKKFGIDVKNVRIKEK